MGRSSLCVQIFSLVKRNIIIKGRVKKEMFTEVLWPIMFMILLAPIKYLAGVTNISGQSVASFPEENLRTNLTGELLVIPPQAVFFLGNATKRFMEGSDILVKGFADEKSAENYYDSGRNTSQIIAAVIFHSLYSNYTIRTDFYITPSPYRYISAVHDCRPESAVCPAKLYIESGFVSIQYAIDSAILESKNLSLPRIRIEQMPKSSFIPDSEFIRQFAPVYYVYAYSFFIQFLVYALVCEKKSRTKEMLRIMGMRDAAYWISWAFIYFCIIIGVTIVAVLIAYLTSLFRPPSNLFIFFTLLALYGCSIINLAFLFNSFLNNPKVAGPVAVLATTAISSLFVVVSATTEYDANGRPISTLPLSVQWLLCLFSPTALSIGIERAIYLDVSQIGVTFSSLSFGDFPLYAPIIMLIVDSVLYLFLAIWLDNILPGEFGQNKPPWFCLLPRYWCNQHVQPEKVKLVIDEFGDGAQICDHIEPVPEELKDLDRLRLFDIKKTYNTSNKTVEAVKGVSLDIYEGEITCLLGHNGAGKTTLMNILTGLTLPTSGTALIYGMDIRDPSKIAKIRAMTGMCPQYDVLVDNMTCSEHLLLYASLKGIPLSSRASEVARILRDIDLVDKADCLTKNLSGGQKRKLSVGIAFIGSPKVIFLDEPSAGMDPKSRRHLWALLKNKKHGRVIVLTTHFMDEADILADRKAIISKGRLRCCGSSLYLKTRFGIGYNLNLVVHDRNYKAEDTELLVRHYVPGAEVAHSHGMEVCFSLPLSQVDKFTDLFRKLEEPCLPGSNLRRAALFGIINYGISMTSLEEVFLRLAEIAESEEAEVERLEDLGRRSSFSNIATDPKPAPGKHNKRLLPNLSDILAKYDPSLRSNALHVFLAVLKIRFLISLRDKMALFTTMILPAILILIGAIILKTANIQYNPTLKHTQLKSSIVYLGYPYDAHFIVQQNVTEPTSSLITNLANFSGLSPHISSDDLLSLDPHIFGIREDGNDSLTILYNDTWIHGLPSVLSLLSNAVLYKADPAAFTKNTTTTTPSSADSSSTSGFFSPEQMITTYSRSWRSQTAQLVFHGTLFTFPLIFGFAIIFLPTSVAQSVVYDRTGKAKSQLRIAGLSPTMYWMTTFARDSVQYWVVGLGIIVAILTFQLRALMSPGAMICIVLFLLLYIPLFILTAYVISYGFNSAERSNGLIQTSMSLLNILCYVPVGMMAMQLDAHTRRVADILHLLFTFINPYYSPSGFFFQLLRLDVAQSYTQQSELPLILFSSYFHWDNLILPSFIAPLIWIPLLLVLLRVVDGRYAGKRLSEIFPSRTPGPTVRTNSYVIQEEDEDVSAERKLVSAQDLVSRKSFGPDQPVVLVENLRKQFTRPQMKGKQKQMVAVKNLSFKVMPGEVLGLLGPNGAGKSTTLNMLTAELTPDAGAVMTGTTNIHTNLKDAYRKMGYCPQFDAVWPLITIREHLRAYAVVRGYHPSTVNDVTNYFLELLQLEEHADKRAIMLSGGTKRKLSFAMAMLGNPRVVFLDEPSTGLDPQSKRVFWDAIKHSFSGSDRGAILTTHYMEEADALCNRIGIMINGQLECLGTSQHLKTRFGNGYQLEVKLATMNEHRILEEVDKLHAFIFRNFPHSHILEQFGPRVAYRIANEDVKSLAHSFRILEKGKKQINIGEYNFSQATLEQVFLGFAKFQMSDSNTITEQHNRSLDLANARKVSERTSKVTTVFSNGTPSEQDRAIQDLDKKMTQNVANFVAKVKVDALDKQAEYEAEDTLGAVAPKLHHLNTDDIRGSSIDSDAESITSQIYPANDRCAPMDNNSIYAVHPKLFGAPSVLKNSSHSQRSLANKKKPLNKNKEFGGSVVKFDVRPAADLNESNNSAVAHSGDSTRRASDSADRIRMIRINMTNTTPSGNHSSDDDGDASLPLLRPDVHEEAEL